MEYIFSGVDDWYVSVCVCARIIDLLDPTSLTSPNFRLRYK